MKGVKKEEGRRGEFEAIKHTFNSDARHKERKPKMF